MLYFFQTFLCSCQGSTEILCNGIIAKSPASYQFYLLNSFNKINDKKLGSLVVENKTKSHPTKNSSFRFKEGESVEVSGLEPLTSCLQSRRSTN